MSCRFRVHFFQHPVAGPLAGRVCQTPLWALRSARLEPPNFMHVHRIPVSQEMSARVTEPGFMATDMSEQRGQPEAVTTIST